jgi:hypothetical protein
MKIKCGRNEYDLTDKDVIMFSRACYQLITRRTGTGWNESIPIVSKILVDKLIKQNKLVMFKVTGTPEKNNRLEYYKINEQEDK